MARQLLNQPDRGGLQSASFHTLRTYLTPVARILNDWMNRALQKPTDSTA
jgi:hypothetical protein